MKMLKNILALEMLLFWKLEFSNLLPINTIVIFKAKYFFMKLKVADTIRSLGSITHIRY